jgi:hypothetical protein
MSCSALWTDALRHPSPEHGVGRAEKDAPADSVDLASGDVSAPLFQSL